MWLAACWGGHPGDGNVQTLCGWQLVGAVPQGMGICKQTFQKNVGALKVVVLLVDFFMEWTFFWLSCVTGLVALFGHNYRNTALICNQQELFGAPGLGGPGDGERANSMKLSQCRGGPPGDGNAQTQ